MITSSVDVALMMWVGLGRGVKRKGLELRREWGGDRRVEMRGVWGLGEVMEGGDLER